MNRKYKIYYFILDQTLQLETEGPRVLMNLKIHPVPKLKIKSVDVSNCPYPLTPPLSPMKPALQLTQYQL